MSDNNSIGIGIIGCGQRGAVCLGVCLAQTYPETNFVIKAMCDRNPDRMTHAISELRRHYGKHGVELLPNCYLDYNDLIADPNVDVVMVTSPQYLHREHALAAMAAGKKVYLDKPIAHTAEDAVAIAEAEKATGSPVILGFTRRYEEAWLKAYQLLAEGAIGDLAMMHMRGVFPYFRFFSRWHRERRWSGGSLNDKGSHLFDTFNWFNTGSKAETLHAFGGRRVFQPDENAPERCNDCDRDCPYRTELINAVNTATDIVPFQSDTSWEAESETEHRKDTCVYAPGADIYDHVSVQFRYDNGVIAALEYAIFGPGADDEETFELVGTKGRLIITRHIGEIDLIADYGKRRERIDCKHPEFNHSHFGADLRLIREMKQWYHGTPPVVGVPEGLEATRLVMAALKAVDEGGRVVQMSEIPDASL